MVLPQIVTRDARYGGKVVLEGVLHAMCLIPPIDNSADSAHFALLLN